MFNLSSSFQEQGFGAWEQGLEGLPPSKVRIRETEPTKPDGRWMQWMQASCESTYIQSVEYNLSTIEQQLILLAEIADYPVGFCFALAGRTLSDPLFIQLVAVVPLARRRGVGLALLSAAAGHEPHRSIAMATLDDNVPARNLNERFAKSIGGNLHRVPIRRYRQTDLGFAQGERHHPWIVDRPQQAE